jgi:predicted transcriptional regulator
MTLTLNEIIRKLDLTVLTETNDFAEIPVKSGYCSDLLSCVMTGAEPEGLWITLMSHSNIVAVAALLDLSAIIITEDAQPDQETIDKANDKGVTMLSTPDPNYEIIGRLWELGLKATKN